MYAEATGGGQTDLVAHPTGELNRDATRIPSNEAADVPRSPERENSGASERDRRGVAHLEVGADQSAEDDRTRQAAAWENVQADPGPSEASDIPSADAMRERRPDQHGTDGNDSGDGNGRGYRDGGGSGGGSADAYKPTDRTDEELQDDLDPDPRDGETTEQAVDRVDAAEAEAEVRRYIETYEQLGDDPPEFDIASNDVDHQNLTGRDHPHTNERHGPDVRLERDPTGVDRTIEGRIYGDPPWNNQTNCSFRWDDPSVQNRAVNEYVNEHWDDIRHDLAATGEHSGSFDFGNRAGEGYYNDGAYGAGPRQAHYHVTSHVELRIGIVPGSNPAEPYIVSAFPSANPRG